MSKRSNERITDRTKDRMNELQKTNERTNERTTNQTKDRMNKVQIDKSTKEIIPQ